MANDNTYSKHIPKIFWTKFVTSGTECASNALFPQSLFVTQIYGKYYDIEVLRDLNCFFDALPSLALIMPMSNVEAE